MRPRKQLTKNFHMDEFQCHNNDPVPWKYYDNILLLAQNLQVLRDHINRPVRITSGYRELYYNRNLGSKDTSQHVICKAADITVDGMSADEVHTEIENLVFEDKMVEGGLGSYPNFTHYDVREKRARW